MNLSFFDQFFIWPFLNLLLAIHKFFEILNFPFSLGFSIIALTILVRLVLWPITNTQLKSAAKMSQLRPKLEELKKRFGGNKKRLQAEQLALYRAHGVNPAAGCLPLIVQIPIFIALYQVLLRVLGANSEEILNQLNQIAYWPALQVDQAPDLIFFGFNLALKPVDFTQGAPLLLLVPPVTAFFQFIQTKMLINPSTQKEQNVKKPKLGEKGQEDMMASIQSQMSFLGPAMIGVFSFGFPIGLSLYWNTFTIFGIIQQYLISGWGGAAQFIPWRAKRANDRKPNN